MNDARHNPATFRALFSDWLPGLPGCPDLVGGEDITLQLNKVVQKVEVRDKATAVSTQEVPLTATINSREFTNLPLAEQKLKAALPIVPGVVRSQEGKLNIKGSPEEQGMLLVDSVQTVDPVTGSFSIPVPVDVIETMDVYKTPYSSEYGGFSGGLTTIQTKPPSGRFGLYSPDVTNRFNPLDVYNNVTSPYFGHFVGYQRRHDGFVIDLVR